MSEIRNAWGFTLFADDLRHEVGGKTSLTGIYQLDMIHPLDFPITIPKFVMLIKYYEVKGAFNGDLVVKVFFPGDAEDEPTVNMTAAGSFRDSVEPTYQADADSERILNVTMPIVISPITIKEEGFIRVRVQCGETITRMGRLMIRKVRDSDNIQFIPSPSASPPPFSQPPPAAPAS
jgi:hypothetical protein